MTAIWVETGVLGSTLLLFLAFGLDGMMPLLLGGARCSGCVLKGTWKSIGWSAVLHAAKPAVTFGTRVSCNTTFGTRLSCDNALVQGLLQPSQSMFRGGHGPRSVARLVKGIRGQRTK